MSHDDFKEISIVIPVFNEEGSVGILYENISHVINGLNYEFEVVFVDDGSQDDTFRNLQGIHEKDNRVKIIRHRGNFGKAAAYSSGFAYAHGEIVITMDGDLQDDPREIPKFIEKIREGYDVVNGWKYLGKGPFTKRVPSVIFNRVTSFLSGIRLNDFNCPFKAYRSEVVKNLQIYGDLYRFIPVMAIKRGFTVAEIKTSNFQRLYGKSKYGANRFLHGFLDLLTVLFLTKFSRSPLHLYGAMGLISSFVGVCILFYMLLFKMITDQSIGDRPLLILGVLLFIIGIQFISVGLICEIIISGRSSSRDRLNIKNILE